MSVKAILVLCAQALLLKSVFGQCISRAAVADISGLAAPCGWEAPALATPCGLVAPALAYDGLTYPGVGLAGLAYDGIYAPALEFSPTSGGALLVSSYSPIAPIGVFVESDNVYEGILTVGGDLPFVSAVALEGVVPAAGAGAVNHACGNGWTAMISETTGFAPATAMAPLVDAAFVPAAIAAPGLGLHGGWAGRGCGCVY